MAQLKSERIVETAILKLNSTTTLRQIPQDLHSIQDTIFDHVKSFRRRRVGELQVDCCNFVAPPKQTRPHSAR